MMGNDKVSVGPNREELLPRALAVSTNFTDNGSRGLESARELFTKEMMARDSHRGGSYMPWVIEGKSERDGKVVYREKSVGANLPPNLNDIPQGQEENVRYAVVSYEIYKKSD